MNDITRLRHFVNDFTALIDDVGTDEVQIFEQGTPMLSRLVAVDDWLPETFAETDPLRYRQYLLHCDPYQRFSVVSFVWGPGQHTPVHDHTVWGMVSVLRGVERCEEFVFDTVVNTLRKTGEHLMHPGQVDRVSPRIGDIHRVSNARTDGPSVSIHVYGANIGPLQRHLYDEVGGERRSFVSGYSSDLLPNLWR